METLTTNGVIATAPAGPMVSGQANAHMAHLERRLLFWRGEWELNCTGATPTKRKNNLALVQSVCSQDGLFLAVAWKGHIVTY